MKTYIAFLRGINVGGHKKIPMAELRGILMAEGLKKVTTYIQSGNVIFTSEEEPNSLALKISEAIQNHFGFKVPVLMVSPETLQYVFNACPFPKEKKKNSYFSLLYTIPDEASIIEISNISYPNEEIMVTKSCVYFYASAGYARTKFNNNFFENKLKVTATARNYKTMLKLLSLLAEY
ncbi:MAG: DUF1697 domain-containing protein [Aestuariibaculum sp.]